MSPRVRRSLTVLIAAVLLGGSGMYAGAAQRQQELEIEQVLHTKDGSPAER
jgi:hypothetical protein